MSIKILTTYICGIPTYLSINLHSDYKSLIRRFYRSNYDFFCGQTENMLFR